MSAVLALQAARKAGGNVFVRDGRLIVQSQGKLSAAVLGGLKTYRDRLVDYLTLEQSPAEDASAEYERLGAEIDMLADQASAARAVGDLQTADRLGQACRELVEGPYRAARERSSAQAQEAA